MKTKKIEEKWQEKWQEKNIYRAIDGDKDKEKKYILVEFPYPSGSGLHIGHTFTMTGADIYARKVRMEGNNVLFPMGWDAFGLPTENYAIKTGQKPQLVTKINTDNFRRQMKKLAFSFDWEREINTADPSYYQWTQWIFIQLFKQGLAYKKEKPINWCPSCKIGLANEEVIDGRCERCGAEVISMKLNQWVVRITNYADRLLEGLKKTDFPVKVKKAQINWIGKSQGAKIKFKVQNFKYIEVFTTRPDTLWGATFMVVAPEHPLIREIQNSKLKTQNNIQASNVKIKEIRAYVEQARKKSDLERAELQKDKTGVFTGLYAINPVNNKKIPIWISDFVLSTYGTGAIMAVPAHDERDHAFARKFDLPIIPVIDPPKKWDFEAKAYTDVDQGTMINSDFINGLAPSEAIKRTIIWLEEREIGQKSVSYHLRDWIFSRQHYWGEPIPMIFCKHCSQKIKTQSPKLKTNSKPRISNDQKEGIKEIAEYAEKNKIDLGALLSNPGWFPVSEKDLPVKLPPVDRYEPTDTGESPLAKMKKWREAKCPICGKMASRETDTMPNWAGSDWYYLAYVLAHRLGNSKFQIPNSKQTSKYLNTHDLDIDFSQNIFKKNKKILDYWLPVDVYIGGDEHNTLHLLYSRFIYQFLNDIGVVPKNKLEPYSKRISHGVILGMDGQKMSKSRGNVINPDDKWQKYGVDALRMYLMFMGPFEATMAWNENAFKGVVRFLDRFQTMIKNQINEKRKVVKKDKEEINILINKLIKKVGEDIDNFHYNTAIAAMMKTLNEIERQKWLLTKQQSADLVKLLAPFAPYSAEELWCKVLRRDFSVHQKSWPEWKKELLEEKMITIIVQVNGHLRGKIDVESNIAEQKDKVILKAKENERTKNYLKDKKIKKIIFVPSRVINFVV